MILNKTQKVPTLKSKLRALIETNLPFKNKTSVWMKNWTFWWNSGKQKEFECKSYSPF
jgi:hypothetical protein